MPESTEANSSKALFAEPKPERSFPSAAVGIAVAALLVLAVVLLVFGRQRGSGGEDASYAPNVQIGNIQMSESESLSGGKSTYLDGHITNHGPRTVTGASVRVSFPADNGAAPQILPATVQLIRMREPYIDVAPISAAPLAPGAGADFRLIFEGVGEAWNQQVPSIQVSGVSTR